MKKRTRGFASMNAEQRSKIARMGGVAAHKKGNAHEFSSTEARIAGRKGGLSSGKSRRRNARKGTSSQLQT